MARTRQPEREPGPLDAIGLGALGATRMSDISRGLRRYRGPGILVLGIVLLSAVLPGPSLLGGSDVRDAASAAFANDPGAQEVVSEKVIDSGGDAALGDTGSDLSFSPAPNSPAASSYSFSSAGSQFPSTAPASPSASSGRATFSSAAPERLDPLTIRGAAWSSAAAGTPFAGSQVPDGSLPVGMRVGQEDKLSFVKLAGDESVLRLAPIGEDGQRSPDAAVILACPVTTAGWTEGQAMSFSEDPEYDCANAVEGKRLEDGSWTFDLSAFPNRTDDRGFALVPSGDGLADFQVAFRAGA